VKKRGAVKDSELVVGEKTFFLEFSKTWENRNEKRVQLTIEHQ